MNILQSSSQCSALLVGICQSDSVDTKSISSIIFVHPLASERHRRLRTHFEEKLWPLCGPGNQLDSFGFGSSKNIIEKRTDLRKLSTALINVIMEKRRIEAEVGWPVFVFGFFFSNMRRKGS